MRNKLHDISIFPERLKNRRESLGITQESLAEKIGVSVRTINSWENAAPQDGGGPKAANIISLCNALDCSFDYLFGASDNPTEQHRAALVELGLSNEAVDILRLDAENKQSKIPAFRYSGKHRLDFYSLFIADHGISNIIGFCFDKKMDLERDGAKDKDIDSLYSEKNIYDFIQFLLNREVTRFINDYFKNIE